MAEDFATVDGDGQAARGADAPPTDAEWWGSNYLFARVKPADRARILERLEPVSLAAGTTLYMPGDPLTHVYFPSSGMISLIAEDAGGRSTEASTIGREGAVGMSASGYVDAAFARCAVRIPGSAFRTPAADFEDMIDMSPELCSAVARWREVMLRMTLQLVACNALHNVRQRCARWILTTRDRFEADPLPLTQELLADMLGVKRNAISVVAREFGAAGAIDYKRGQISVLDADALGHAACECYGLIRREVDKLANDPLSPECVD